MINLLKKEDIAEYRNMSEHMDKESMDAFITEAQLIDLRQFIGDKLFLYLTEDYNEEDNTFTEDRVTDLWFGAKYNDIEFFGLKPMLAYYAYARILENVAGNLTRSGFRNFGDDEVSSEITTAQLNTKVASIRSIALVYQNNAKDFLDYNAKVYPEWERTNREKTGFKFFKV